MKRHIRFGFTLVELLVVMTIIGMLIALLLPAVNAARETARKATCTKNLGELSMALVAFDNRKQYFPGYKNQLSMTNAALDTWGPAPPGNAPDGYFDVGWVMMILPDIGRGDIFDKVVGGGTGPEIFDVNIELAQCPNDPPLTLSPGRMSYIANCGYRDSDDLYSGVFNNLGERKSVRNQQRVSSAFIASKDGVANTVLLSEHPVDFTLPNKSGCSMSGKNARKWQPSSVEQDAAASCMDVIGGFWLEDLQDVTAARPRSKHPGGTHYSFADGHVLFLSENVDLKTIQKLMTPEGNYSGVGKPTSTVKIPWPQTAISSAELER